MKRYFYLILFLIIVSGISSCKKKSETPNPTGSTCVDMISQEYIISKVSGTTDTTVAKYFYNSDKKVVQIKYYTAKDVYVSYDTIVYDNLGQLSNVKSYQVSNLSSPYRIDNYTYSNGKVVSINETSSDPTNTYDKTTNYTYIGDNLSYDTVIYATGTPYSNEILAAKSIVYTGNDISTANVYIKGNGWQNITLSYDDKANPYYKRFFPQDIITSIFNVNNLTGVTATIYINNFPFSQQIITNSYTYDSNGKIITTSTTSALSTDTQSKTITYDCY